MYCIQKPFPVCEDVQLRFVAYLYKEGLKAGTVKSYLAAVRHSQIALGFGDPLIGSMVRLEYVVRGVKKLTSGPVRTRIPITLDLLVQLRRSWYSERRERDAVMLWAAASLCFFGFLRVGEIVVPSDSGFDPSWHLGVADVSVDNHACPTYVAVRIKTSKTDPFRQGVTVYLGRTEGVVCPVAAMLSYIVRRGASQGPLFVFEDGKCLTRDRFVGAMRGALLAAGIDASKYAGHSFRIGAATTAARKGVQDSLIKTMGHWESSAYTLYIWTPRETLCVVAGTLVSSNGGGQDGPAAVLTIGK